MTEITNTIQIQGPLAAVFDLVTTTRFWPQWHPATIGVGGVTERPFQQGDQICERAKIGEHVYEGIWTVVEHLRPAQAVLEGRSGRISIRYAFQQQQDAVAYSRTLVYHPEDFAAGVGDPSRLEKFMDQQSQQALQKLKALVEQILTDEAKVEIRE